MGNLLDVQHLSKIYEESLAVNDASFSVSQGEVVAIFGESGCGKSSLLRMISGFLEPDGGRVFINQKELPYPSEILMPGDPDIEIVKQDYDLFPNHKIEEVIDYKLRKYPEDYIQERTEELLNLCGLQEYRYKIIKNLSGGQQQRVAIAQALANEPDVILMDEPFNSLDIGRKRSLRKLIRSIVDTLNISVVLVTHDAEDVFVLADKLIVMNNGRFIQEGKPLDVYRSSQNKYVAELLGEINYIDESTGVRPEDLVIHEDSKGDQFIKEVDFNGGYFRYVITDNEKDWIVYDTKKREKGGTIRLSYDENELVKIKERV